MLSALTTVKYVCLDLSLDTDVQLNRFKLIIYLFFRKYILLVVK